MKFKTVHAIGFGCLRNAKLELAPKFNVVFGPNEAGKSTWHAAMYASLCGVRRGAGIRTEDREFRERYKPWGGEPWHVKARIELANGNDYALIHDLDGKVNCSVTDAATGKDVSNTVIFDGSPDGSTWLGLNRRLFLRVACVGQADILGILDSAGALQDRLQKAVASPDARATAASALEKIRTFRKENVGLDRSNSNRPLAAANRSVKELEARLSEARRAHGEYAMMIERATKTQAHAAGIDRRSRELDAAVCRREANGLQMKLERLLQLAAKFSNGAPPDLEQDEERARRVTEALKMWRERPEKPELQGETASEIEDQLASLPPAPDGDISEHESVAEAARARELSQALLAEHDSRRPVDAGRSPVSTADPWTLRRLADDLSMEPPDVPVDLVEAAEAARARAAVASKWGGKTIALGMVSAVGALAGAGMLLAGFLTGGIGTIVIAAAAAIGTVLVRDKSSLLLALQRQTEAEAALAMAQGELQRATERQRAAKAQSVALGITPDPGELRRAASEIESQGSEGAALANWQRRRESLVSELLQRDEALREVLIGRGAAVNEDIGLSLNDYRNRCAENAHRAQRAAIRDTLLRRLEDRRALEQSAAEERTRLDDATRGLAAAARSVGVEDSEPNVIEVQLKLWQQRRQQQLVDNARDRSEWQELTSLRDESDEQDRARRVQELLDRADKLFPGKTSELETASIDELRRLLESSRREAADAAKVAAAEAGEARQFAATMLSVSDCEEALQAARARLERITELDAVLEKSERLLASAEEAVQRNIAPVIASFVGPRLKKVTAGRYSQVTVDPADLTVNVVDSTHTPRRAMGLSHGTAEQAYFLVRAALANVLCKPDEPTPLLLDDVTVQSDRERTRAILEVLHDLSETHQVVLFTQEDDVLEWAEQNLYEPHDRLHRLVAPVT